MTIPLDGVLPASAHATLKALRDALRRTAGDNLVALVLYGGVARGRYRAGASDINVVVVLRDASAEAVRAIAPVLHEAWRAARVEPLVLASAEIARAAVAFPTKMLDIVRHHLVIDGDDPFAELAISPAHVRLRVEQELRNLLLRMRRRLIAAGDDRRELAVIAGSAAVPLAVNLRALLYLAGGARFEAQPTLPLFDAAADVFGLDRSALGVVKRAHETPDRSELSPAQLTSVLSTVARAAELACVGEDGDGRA